MSDVELTVSVGRKEPGALRLVATLAIAATLSGIVLSGVFQITSPSSARTRARFADRLDSAAGFTRWKTMLDRTTSTFSLPMTSSSGRKLRDSLSRIEWKLTSSIPRKSS